MPFIVLSREFELIEMADDACHGHGTVAPWWTKVEIEIIILHIWITGNASLQTHELDITTHISISTYRSDLPST